MQLLDSDVTTTVPYGCSSSPDDEDGDNNNKVQITSVHAASMLLNRTVRDVDRSTGEDEQQVRRLQMSAPPSFPVDALERLVTSASLAGFDVQQPVYYDISCAAMVWGKRNAGTEETVLFVDVGEGFTTCQAVKFSKKEEGDDANKMSVLATRSARCGVGAFDDALVQLWSEEISQHKKIGASTLASRRVQSRLRKEARRTKERLSTVDSIRTMIESLTPDVDFSCTSRRADMEARAAETIRQITEVVAGCIAEAAAAEETITRVEVIGGGTRIPCIASMIQNEANGLPLSKTLDSEHAVTYGTCLFGTNLFTISGAVAHPEVSIASDKSIEEIKALEAKMQERDAELQLRSESKNKMEEYIFAMRHKIEEEQYKKLVGDSDAFLKLLQTEEFWLEDLEDDVPSSQIIQRFDDLKKQAESKEPELVKEISRVKEEEAKKAAQARMEALEAKMAAPLKKKKKIVRPAEKVATAKARKDHGNSLFKDNNFEDATRRYTQALSLCSEVSGTVEPELQTEVDKIKMSCYLNLSLCNMKLKRVGLARHNAESAVRMDASNVKASFRLASALLELKDLPEAKKVIDAILQLEPDNKTMLQMRAKYERAKEIERRKEKKMYGNMFG